jgi:DNA (cytosine-5)-methyltransferase 1
VSTCPVCGASGRPLLADWFCGAGGAGLGYLLAGFHIVGWDLEPQPRYPGCFVLGDALEASLDGYDAAHASPPCQAYSLNMRCFAKGNPPQLIDAVRDRFQGSGLKLWVIENVVGAPLPRQSDLWGAHGIELCGTMFDLPLWRHRLFETSVPVPLPRRGCDHSTQPLNPFRDNRPGGHTLERRYRAAMGVGWMQKMEGRQAVPPAYTCHIGRALLAAASDLEAAS